MDAVAEWLKPLTSIPRVHKVVGSNLGGVWWIKRGDFYDPPDQRQVQIC